MSQCVRVFHALIFVCREDSLFSIREFMSGLIVSTSPGVNDLKRYSLQFTADILKQELSAATILKKIITLLEIFKYQIRKLDPLGYCDHELALFCFEVAQRLNASLREITDTALIPLIDDVGKTLLALQSCELRVETCFYNKECDVPQDNLEGRLLKLKFSSNRQLVGYPVNMYQDHVSPSELNNQLRTCPDSVLLLDFRSKKEFAYSHINFGNILNIEPQIIKSLFNDLENPTVEDLEVALEQEGMTEKELALFRKRNEYDMVVMYDLKFGLVSDNKFESLMPLITGANETFLSNNPFKDLIELLIFRCDCKNLRSKRFPLFLNGGLQRWYQVQGEAGLARQLVSFVDNLEDVANIRHSLHSKYLKTFQDYLGSGFDKIGYPRETSLSMKADFDSIKDMKSQGPAEKLTSTNIFVPETKKSAKSCSTGLNNLGNSCYMNCVLQCLVASPGLPEFLVPSILKKEGDEAGSFRNHINVENPLGLRGVITSVFADLLEQMWLNDGKTIAPVKFKKVVGSFSPGSQFSTTDQQDCIEFLNFMLDSLHEDLNQRLVNTLNERKAISELSGEQEKVRETLPVRLASTVEWERYLKLNFSIIVDLFQGQYVSRLRCLVCDFTSSTYNSFSTLSLPIPEKLVNSKQTILLFECLDMFVETELLDEDNKWHCPNCKQFTRLTKKLIISRLPRILIIHLKRFKTENGRFKKLENFVQYPVDDLLDLTRFWPPVGSHINRMSQDRFSEAKELELLSKFPDRGQKPPFKYLLYGVVNHFGNLTTGHYTSFVRQSNSPTDWTYFDDSKVTHKCKQSNVLNQNAYCLFYSRC